jgi:ABC-2 type transport system permease protein
VRNWKLLLAQVRYVNKTFWRNPASAFFTFAFPLMFLVIFTSLLGNYNLHLPGKVVRASSYYVAAMAGFSAISACYTNVAMTVTFQRDLGVLKRTHGSPLPDWVFLGAKVIHATLVALLLLVITAAFGTSFYHASIPSGSSLLFFLIMFIVGAASFSALGFAISGFIPNSDAAPAIVNASILPVLFLSGIFVPLDNKSPLWIVWIARIFPVRHFATGLEAGFLKTPFLWSDVGVVALWGVFGLAVAVRKFSWEPRT